MCIFANVIQEASINFEISIPDISDKEDNSNIENQHKICYY